MKKIKPIKSVLLYHKKKVDKYSSGNRRLTGEGVYYYKRLFRQLENATVQIVLEHGKLLKRDTVNYGTALTWTLYFFQFEKHLPQREIKSTRRIHLEIRFNILPSVSFGPRSFTENLLLSKVLLIISLFYHVFG